MNKPYWNYRLVRRQFADNEALIGIYEAHYDADSTDPHSISSDPVTVVSDTGSQVSEILRKMQQATEKPILRYEDF